MIDLGTADGWFTITNRGPCASFGKGRVPEGFACPRELQGHDVVIDGTPYKVHGVGHFAIQCDGCDSSYSLLVAKT